MKRKLPEWAEPIVGAVSQRFGVRLQPALHAVLVDAAQELLEQGQGPAERIAERIARGGADDAVVARMRQAVSVGETYFYRLPRQLERLSELVRTSLVPKKRASGDFTLRAWSAGCSTGEEAYTLAMLLRAAAPGFDVQVVGTDMNESSLQWAQAGFYRPRSVRGLLPPEVKGLLLEVGAGFEVHPALRRTVQFLRHDLLQDALPDPRHGLEKFDIVLLRNVLIYFDPVMLPKLMRRVSSACAVPSVIALTPAEYRAGDHLPAHRAVGHALFTCGLDVEVAQVLPAEPPARRSKPEERERPKAPEPLPRPSANVSVVMAVLMDKARAAADRGALEEASMLARSAVALNEVDPSARHLLGVILLTQHDFAGAARELQRALFLDRSHAPAHFALGQALRRLGLDREAAAHLQRAVELFSALPPRQEVPELQVSAEVAARLARAELCDPLARTA